VKRTRSTPKTRGDGNAAEPSKETKAKPAVVIEEGAAHGPERIEDLRRKADDMVVGERTVIHNAAHYGIVRGMTWTVILSALLFWLPILGPATAGYVGGRKAGGPLRGIIAVAIPAIVMFVLLATLQEGLGIVPTGLVGGADIDLDGVADYPAAAVPLIGSLEQSLNTWIAAPPDVLFIMVAFALLGGALSSLRRHEEETVIEKVGIPLGELKERIRQEEFERGESGMIDPPGRWEPHPLISGPAAAHDALNDMVEEIVQRVVLTMQSDGTDAEQYEQTRPVKASRGRTRRRAASKVRTGGEGPHYNDMVTAFTKEPTPEELLPAAHKAGSRRKGAGARSAAPRKVEDAIVGNAEDWMVVDTKKGRRPIRVVHSPVPEALTQRPDGSEVAQPVIAKMTEPGPADDIAEPVMHVEKERGGLFHRGRERIVYSPAEGMDAPTGVNESPLEGSEELIPREHMVKKNFERLPIVGPIIHSMEEKGEVSYTGTISAVEEPGVHDTLEASTIAESAAQDLAEMARYEDGPDMEPEEDTLPPEAKGDLVAKEIQVGEVVSELEEVDIDDLDVDLPKVKAKPKAKSTARKVKHPAGALKSRSRSKARSKAEVMEYDDDMADAAKADWVKSDALEEEDMFNPRRLEDEQPPGDAIEEGSEEGSDEWAEEERIAALMRERDEWDKL
jgi:hypothetical protein